MAILVGNRITADDIQAALDAISGYAIPTQVIKPSSTSRNTTITPTADPHLSITLAANQTFEVQVDVLASSAADAAGDLRLRLAWTNTATVHWWLVSLDSTIASGAVASLQARGITADTTSPTTDTQFGLSATSTGQTMYALVITGGSSVALTLEWAQLASNPNNTTLLAGSRIIARRVA